MVLFSLPPSRRVLRHTPACTTLCSVLSALSFSLSSFLIVRYATSRSVARGNIMTSMHSFCDLATITTKNLARQGCPATTGPKRAEKRVPQNSLPHKHKHKYTAPSLPFFLAPPRHLIQIVVLQTCSLNQAIREYSVLWSIKPGSFSLSLLHAESRTAAGVSTVSVNVVLVVVFSLPSTVMHCWPPTSINCRV
jgi:hypothetical protein